MNVILEGKYASIHDYRVNAAEANKQLDRCEWLPEAEEDWGKTRVNDSKETGS